MDSSSRVALALAAALLFSGCWTGRLYERGRVGESVLAYHAAVTDGERLIVDYSVELEDWKGRPIGRGRRGASIPIDAMEARPEHPVDAFPLERVQLPPVPADHYRSVPILTKGSLPSDPSAPAFLEVVEVGGRHEGFRICAGPGEGCSGRFRSGALYRDGTAWWVYPLLPLSAAMDALLFVPQVVGQSPFFLLGE
jgi:hypothetical protein